MDCSVKFYVIVNETVTTMETRLDSPLNLEWSWKSNFKFQCINVLWDSHWFSTFIPDHLHYYSSWVSTIFKTDDPNSNRNCRLCMTLKWMMNPHQTCHVFSIHFDDDGTSLIHICCVSLSYKPLIFTQFLYHPLHQVPTTQQKFWYRDMTETSCLFNSYVTWLKQKKIVVWRPLQKYR